MMRNYNPRTYAVWWPWPKDWAWGRRTYSETCPILDCWLWGPLEIRRELSLEETHRRIREREETTMTLIDLVRREAERAVKRYPDASFQVWEDRAGLVALELRRPGLGLVHRFHQEIYEQYAGDVVLHIQRTIERLLRSLVSFDYDPVGAVSAGVEKASRTGVDG
jgi:hypothetical protein